MYCGGEGGTRRRQARRRGDFEGVPGQEGKHGKREDGLERGVGERGEPEGSGGEDDEAAGGGDEGGGGKSTLGAAPEDGDEERGEGIGEQVAAGGSEEVGQAGERAGGEDGQAHGALGEIGSEGGCGEARGKQQAQQEDGKGRERKRHGREEEGHRDVGADGGEGAAEENDAGCAKPGDGPGRDS
jgi:transcription termination factor Rho